jgi:hypothetical protein
MAGNILARCIVEADDSWRLFSPYEFVWAGGKLGRAVKQVYYWYFRARERFEARHAREREGEVQRMAARGPHRLQEPAVRTEPDLLPEELFGEPVTAGLPADPVMTDAPVPVAPPMTRIADAPFTEPQRPPPPPMSLEQAEATIAHEQTKLAQIAEDSFRDELAEFEERENDDRASHERTA